MASITSTITLIDRMTPVLDNIINGMQTTINMLDRTDGKLPLICQEVKKPKQPMEQPMLSYAR